MSCKHDGDFLADVEVTRLIDSGRFTADVRIKCKSCGVSMRFIGLPGGLDLNGATTSADATEARLAIAPLGEVVPPLAGPHGFSVRGPSPDLRRALDEHALIEFLVADEGDGVTINSDNADGEPNCAVDVSGDYTGWIEKRFTGETRLACLEAAAKFKRENVK